MRERVDRGIVATLQATQVFPELTVLENAIVGARLAPHGGGLRAVLGTPKAVPRTRELRGPAHAALAAVGLAGVAPSGPTSSPARRSAG